MKDIISSEPITIPEVREIFSQIDPDQLDQIQRWTFDYTAKFSKTDPDKARLMRRALIEECDLTDTEAVEIVNIMPETIAEIRSFTFGWKKLILAETLSKMLRILKET